jgi:cell division septum initiation protein DivIVA
MPSSEHGRTETETDTPTVDNGGVAVADEVETEPSHPATADESPTSRAARMLELAAGTADQLISDAETEAEAIVATSRNDAARAEAELVRTREEQTAELERERSTALAGLAEEKAALEEQIAQLRRTESDYRDRMRHQLNEQLSLLETSQSEPESESVAD